MSEIWVSDSNLGNFWLEGASEFFLSFTWLTLGWTPQSHPALSMQISVSLSQSKMSELREYILFCWMTSCMRWSIDWVFCPSKMEWSLRSLENAYLILYKLIIPFQYCTIDYFSLFFQEPFIEHLAYSSYMLKVQ